MKYEELSKLYYRSQESDRDKIVEQELTARRDASSSFKINFATKTGGLFIAVPREMTVLSERILRRERKISKLMQQLPGIAGDEVLRTLVFDEVICSNAIENIHSTRKEIENALRNNGKSHEKQRFREFARLYLDMTFSETSLPTKPADVRAIYDKIMDGEKLDDAPDGKLFRKKEVYITDGMKQIHTGLYPEDKITAAIETMLKLANSEEIPSLYAAIASHYIFEYAHPFYDGNGRTGRYLLSMFLEDSLSKPTALSLSRAIANNKSAYYKAFKVVENPLNHAELTFFVYAILEMIADAQEELIEGLTIGNKRYSQLTKRCDDIGKDAAFNEKENSIVFILAQQAEFGMFKDVPLDVIAEYLNLGKQQTRKYLTKLIDAEVIEKVSGRDPVTFALTDKFFESHLTKFDDPANLDEISETDDSESN